MSAPVQDVLVVGAGVAGLAAAHSLATAGAKVTLLERRAFVGGRAYSYKHPALNEVVDSQHVMVGCCTNLIELCDSAGLAGKIRWYDKQTFLQPADRGRDVRSSTIESGLLPAPLQYAGSFLRASMLSVADKFSIARGLRDFVRGYPACDDRSMAQWYGDSAQTQGAIRHFWEPILLATLNDSAANCSTKYAGKVFHELFVKNSAGGRLGIPAVPLSEFYGSVAKMAQEKGCVFEPRVSVDRIAQGQDGGWVAYAGERTFRAEKMLLALPFEQTRTLLQGLEVADGAYEDERDGLLEKMGHFVHSPFISILLWYDREITELDHAWLLDTNIQWFFHKSRIREYERGSGSYIELVIAGSKQDLLLPREQLLQQSLLELERFFPVVRCVKLVKSAILKEARATFSVLPGLDQYRPSQSTGIRGLYLAGDWTATGWPSTMEGAARSGRLAAGEVAGEPLRFMAPELPASGLMSLITP